MQFTRREKLLKSRKTALGAFRNPPPPPGMTVPPPPPSPGGGGGGGGGGHYTTVTEFQYTQLKFFFSAFGACDFLLISYYSLAK